MRRNILSVAVCAISASLASGQIVYELNGSAVSGPNITVATVSGVNTLRVYDSGTAVDESVPAGGTEVVPPRSAPRSRCSAAFLSSVAGGPCLP